MEDLRISVAMCTYNGGRFLHDQLESIAAQTRLPDELVVRDDRSVDETVEVLRTFARRAPFVVRTEVNEKNVGSTNNFEKTISCCEGEIIALADQDDIWKPSKLAVIEAVFEKYPEAGYVFSDAELLDENRAAAQMLWTAIGFRGKLRGDFVNGQQVAVLLRRSVATGATMAFRSRLRRVTVPFSPHWVHDHWIALLASAVGSYGVPVDEPLIQYRQHAGQQLGARKKSPTEKVKRARLGKQTDYSRMALGLGDLKNRLLLARERGITCPAPHMKLVEEKLEHCCLRATAHSVRGAARLKMVLAEALSGRYGRFSNSWQSILEDICF